MVKLTTTILIYVYDLQVFLGLFLLSLFFPLLFHLAGFSSVIVAHQGGRKFLKWRFQGNQD